MAASIAAVIVVAAGCSAQATTSRTAVSGSPLSPQRALRIYPVGTLIADVTRRDRAAVDARGAADLAIARGGSSAGQRNVRRQGVRDLLARFRSRT